MAAHDHLPTYKDLLFPTLRAVKELGGSAHVAEINEWIVEHLSVSDDDLSMTYPNRPDDSVYYDRMAWARSYDKLGGVLESPQRGLYLITALGRDIVSLPPEDAVSRLLEMDREVRRARQRKSDTGGLAAGEEAETDTDAAAPVDDEESEDSELRRMFLSRLHALSPSSFEDFVIFLLKSFGLELEPSGGPGDEGVDAIGLAPISDVLSYRVAVQIKRYDPNSDRSPIQRGEVALFQRDAAAKGAERAVFVTLGRFSKPAEKAATDTTPTVDLINGERLWALAKQKGHGLRHTTVLDENFFLKFE